MNADAVLHYVMSNAMDMILIGIVLSGIAILFKLQATKDRFDLRSVIADDKGQPSIHKIGQLVALLLSTWMLVYLAVHNQMTEGYFGTYMGIWAAAQAADKWLGRAVDKSQDMPQPEPPPGP
jgi:hypothetical protein